MERSRRDSLLAHRDVLVAASSFSGGMHGFDHVARGLVEQTETQLAIVLQKARLTCVDWIENLLAQCKEAGVPCFVKQLGSVPAVSGREADPSHPTFKALEFGLRDRKGGDIEEWPADLRVREFPRCAPHRSGFSSVAPRAGACRRTR